MHVGARAQQSRSWNGVTPKVSNGLANVVKPFRATFSSEQEKANWMKWLGD